MTRLIHFKSIDQFSTMMLTVRDRAKFHNCPMPTLTFEASIKLNGTNASLCTDFSAQSAWLQSREQILTGKDASYHYGFVGFAEDRDNSRVLGILAVEAAIGEFKKKYQDVVSIFGEWVGESVLRKNHCGTSRLHIPNFVILGITIGEGNDRHLLSKERVLKYLAVTKEQCKGMEWPEQIECIYDYPLPQSTVTITESDWMDLENSPAMKLIDQIVENAEKACPYALAHGVPPEEAIGEGAVFRCVTEIEGFRTDDLIFKTVGRKHKETYTVKLTEAEIQLMKTADEFVDAVVTEHRLQKKLQSFTEAGFELTIKNIGQFLKLVGLDVVKEETQRMEASGLEKKDTMGKVNERAKQWFIAQLPSNE